MIIYHGHNEKNGLVFEILKEDADWIIAYKKEIEEDKYYLLCKHCAFVQWGLMYNIRRVEHGSISSECKKNIPENMVASLKLLNS